ncbi:MAG: cyclodeaminase/cyclohydrolase family protein [Candidatus Caldatribacteriota bacterium]|jgi:glutamate formiminotransferase/formiminotetrahydrofolate cyclodeaminase|nr:cyclodeaminase/cyclohydrolase family protein [Atribacterota bacterium]MDD3030934.1 cyclodeaminase/cyclohydrolase family protein [Atribacterota bacterium]MDD3640451.1 cyclodeaminase/cyclohydrolase family protein [Atribacterota bacterium]MDD4288595.1 cyclodeaminase/cyclohydrolase family protein [Atribacterota bacterium]MDD4764802.1 cyclodeaminase/cyclohydrolase family protein [Atribacterota bacterium]
MIKDKKIKSFLDMLASKSPTPGGGSTAALVGAMSAALLSMVGNLTIGKEKYQDVQEDIRRLLKKSEKLRDDFERLIDEDVDAFNQFMAIMKLPKETKEQMEDRNKKIQTALIEAANVPLEIARRSRDVLFICKEISEKGNKNVISDAGVGAILADATLESAILNVKINLTMIKEKKIKIQLDNEIKEIRDSVKGKKDNSLKVVLNRI